MSFLFDKMSREECEAVREADGYEKGKAEGEKLGETRGCLLYTSHLRQAADCAPAMTTVI